MRALLILLPVVLAGCVSSPSRFSVSQRQILQRSQAEIDRREPWAGSAVILVENPDDFTRMTWRVRAGAFDHSDHPSYNGIHFVEGTERELRFSTNGCLTRYSAPGTRCEAVVTTDSNDVPQVSKK